jgi:hypothetical protein
MYSLIKKLFYSSVFLICLYSNQVFATTFTVSNNLNTGAGSLRQAITDANADATTPHFINFSIASGSTGSNQKVVGYAYILDNRNKKKLTSLTPLC